MARGHLLNGEERCEIVNAYAERLIQWLYDPHPGLGWRTNNHVDESGLGHDAINWGDLRVREVTLTTEGVFILDVEEASPEASNLRAWLEERMAAWGWAVRVVTEW